MSHVHRDKPLCYSDTPPDELPAKVPWAIDGGRHCGNARTPEQWRELLTHTPDCAGCTKALRAMYIYWGDAEGEAA